jgi:hypothetical protein
MHGTTHSHFPTYCCMCSLKGMQTFYIPEFEVIYHSVIGFTHSRGGEESGMLEEARVCVMKSEIAQIGELGFMNVVKMSCTNHLMSWE